MACHLPWVGVADGDFPRGFPVPGGLCPGGLCPPFLFSYRPVCGGSSDAP